MGKRKIPREDPAKEVKVSIEAFLHKYADNRKRLLIDEDYQFIIIRLTHIAISQESLYWLNDTEVQFFGEAKAKQLDPASRISTDSDISFNGLATYGYDSENDYQISVGSIMNIKIK